MTDTVTTVSSLNGLFKEVYASKIKDLIPYYSYLYKNIKFVPNDQRSGKNFNQPVVVQGEQGVTYAAAGSGAYALNGASTMVMQNAEVLGSQITIKAVMDNEAAARAVAGGASAFESATKLQIANVMESHYKRLELALLYGQSDLGTVDSSTNVDATSTTITFTTASWADGIWAGMTGAMVSLFKTTNGDILNSNAMLVITAINSATKTLTVLGNATDIAAIDTWCGGAGGQQASINFFGARITGNVYREAVGLDKIITNTGSLFSIDASTYDLWKGNTFPCGSAALTQAKVDSGIAVAVGRGGLSEKQTVLVNPKTWSNLNTDQAAKRVYDSSYDANEFENGAMAIEYKSQSGVLSIVSHPFVKEGEAFALPLDEGERTGATEPTFDLPGQGNGEYFTILSDNMGFQYRSYSNQALLVNTPAKTIKFTGITNS